MTDTCPSYETLLAWLENDLPDEESQRATPPTFAGRLKGALLASVFLGAVVVG